MRLTEKAVRENAKELRIKAMQEMDAKPAVTLQDEMGTRLDLYTDGGNMPQH